MIKKSVYFLLVIFVLVSCASPKKVIYLNDLPNSKTIDSSLSYEAKLQPDDLLSIIVSAENPELTIPFNMPQIQINYSLTGNQSGIKTYLIDNTGFIEYPVVGKIKMAGLTKSEANEVIVKKIADYFKLPPSINLTIVNFKVSVIGQVSKPGSFSITSNRITLLEALSLAGDLTIYGNRKSVLIIRETNGQKTFNRIDLTNSGFIESPFYYLSQNDVVYIEPNRTLVNNSVIGNNISVLLASTSILFSLLILFFKK